MREFHLEHVTGCLCTERSRISELREELDLSEVESRQSRASALQEETLPEEAVARAASGLKRSSRPPPLSISLAQGVSELAEEVERPPVSSVRVESPEDDDDDDARRVQPTQELLMPK